MSRFTRSLIHFVLFAFMALPGAASALDSVYIEDLTWTEIKQKISAGTTTVIIPTGGTEQNGPHMVTSKHNQIVRFASGEVAKKLGNTLVAPVIAYVPEGRISPPEGHMKFPGTLSVSNETFEALLTDTATSLKQHGFKIICFIGDHGGNQPVQQQVAEKLSDLWSNEGIRALQIGDYYAGNGQDAWVDSMGIKVATPSAHAGFIDTSELMAIDARGIRDNMRGNRTERDFDVTGAKGDSRLSSAEYGRRFLAMKVEAATRQIQNATLSSQ